MKAIKYYSLIVLFGMTMSASCQAHASSGKPQSQTEVSRSVKALP